MARQNNPNPPPATKDTNPKDAAAQSRIPLWLLSPIAKAHWALAQFAGMLKYGAWNWRAAGVRSSVYTSALSRHIDAYISGEEHDPIDGTKHLGNIMACAAILLDAEAAGKLTDDRPPSVSLRPTYADLEFLMQNLQDKYADRTPRHYTIADTSEIAIRAMCLPREAFPMGLIDPEDEVLDEWNYGPFNDDDKVGPL